MCDCREARAWREYWSAEAIATRLRAEVELYRQICHERWSAAFNDVRGVARTSADWPKPYGPSHAEMQRRRSE